MNRSILGSIAFVLAFAFVATAQNEDTATRPTCGTEQSMAKMPESARQYAIATSAAFRANELLLYLNFNGGTVRPGFGNADTLTSSIISGVRFCPAPSLTQAQKDEIVRLVRDDFSPFNIRVTTDFAEFQAYPRINKEMCLITTFPSVIGHPSSEGGVSPFASIGLRLPGDLAFVFASPFGNEPVDVAAVVSHESAHLLGLGHQHKFSDTCGLLAEYHPGFGTGPISFDPLMGEATGVGINNWFAQSCIDPFYGVAQNDYELINSQVAVRDDDFPNTPSGGTLSGGEITGILEQAGDVDYMKINFKNPGPVTITSDNIDLKVSVFNNGGKLMGEYNDPFDTNVTIPSVNGLRYLKIEGESNDNMSAQFMTGMYKVTY